MTIRIKLNEEIRSLIITTQCDKCGDTKVYLRNIFDLGKEPHKPVKGDIDWSPKGEVRYYIPPTCPKCSSTKLFFHEWDNNGALMELECGDCGYRGPPKEIEQ